MPRFYLHLRDGTDEILDNDGAEYADPEALRMGVLANARDVIAGEIKCDGILDLRFWIDAEDAQGKVAYRLPFARAVSIISGQ